MKKFEIPQTAHTPYFLVDYETGHILYRGRFIPDMDPFDFMKPLHDAVVEYFASPVKVTMLEVFYEYVNTGNLITFLEFFKLISKNAEKGGQLFCLWHYDDQNDEDSIDMCENVSNYSGLEFEMIDDSLHK